jgi:iron-sulfur cluster insertion protein
MSETGMPILIFLSGNAAAKVKALIVDEGNANLHLRVFVAGEGCSGFRYGLTFDESVTAGDTIIEKGGIRLLIDPMSIQYLSGAEIDFQENLNGARFVINNPNAKTTCGCGSSFAI